MAYGCAGSSPAFRTILKGSNDAKLLFPLSFLPIYKFSICALGIFLVSKGAYFGLVSGKVGADRCNNNSMIPGEVAQWFDGCRVSQWALNLF